MFQLTMIHWQWYLIILSHQSLGCSRVVLSTTRYGTVTDVVAAVPECWFWITSFRLWIKTSFSLLAPDCFLSSVDTYLNNKRYLVISGKKTLRCCYTCCCNFLINIYHNNLLENCKVLITSDSKIMLFFFSGRNAWSWTKACTFHSIAFKNL